jgi:hypothetical protein
MNTQEAANILETIIKSISSNPSQFQFTVNVNMTGFSATAHGGGIGAVGISQGGGIGIQASASIDDTKIQIAQMKAENAINQEVQTLIDALSEMARELRSVSPNKSKLISIYESLKGKWIPGVITSVVGNLISSIFGI